MRKSNTKKWLSKWVSKNKVVRFLIIISLLFEVAWLILIHWPEITELSSVQTIEINPIECLSRELLEIGKKTHQSTSGQNYISIIFENTIAKQEGEIVKQIMRQAEFCKWKQVRNQTTEAGGTQVLGGATINHVYNKLTITITNNNVNLIVETKEINAK